MTRSSRVLDRVRDAPSRLRAKAIASDVPAGQDSRRDSRRSVLRSHSRRARKEGEREKEVVFVGMPVERGEDRESWMRLDGFANSLRCGRCTRRCDDSDGNASLMVQVQWWDPI